MTTTGPRIISTAAELAAVVTAAPQDAPVIIGPPECEPGSDPVVDDCWVVTADVITLPANADGDIAGPGERIAVVDELSLDGVTRRLAGVDALLLRVRQVAVAGQLGPSAMPADPAVRRAEAYDTPDGDMTRYLMELVSAVDELREEIRVRAVDGGMFAPAARRRMERAALALDVARMEVCDASRYASPCDLARLALVDDDGECDSARQEDQWVYLPPEDGSGAGSEELGCRRHASIATCIIPGARIRPDSSL
ncbi:hypothetical protein [Microbispora sp. NBRC 16548]|uniref:hypothetical protein n=1 Tax=Microbispora sp. NBRC 16548 TaxID=3030994 RepID=UPI0024A42AC6|nr:hypothetical protein [Microbispora sp. NBRC 16548]GLX06770.1 hypothetical protein Misp03_36970 [Microbispora sp. NBRC 16548]